MRAVITEEEFNLDDILFHQMPWFLDYGGQKIPCIGYPVSFLYEVDSKVFAYKYYSDTYEIHISGFARPYTVVSSEGYNYVCITCYDARVRVIKYVEDEPICCLAQCFGITQ